MQWMGSPFLSSTKQLDSGMIKVIENDILPRLGKDLPILVSSEDRLTHYLSYHKG
jgi:hypothetical protein